jgi:hypothetical protein
LISAPSPSEAIWRKGDIVKTSKARTPSKKGSRPGFVAPAPKAQTRTQSRETIRTVPPPTPGDSALAIVDTLDGMQTRSKPIAAGQQALLPAIDTDPIVCSPPRSPSRPDLILDPATPVICSEGEATDSSPTPSRGMGSSWRIGQVYAEGKLPPSRSRTS